MWIQADEYWYFILVASIQINPGQYFLYYLCYTMQTCSNNEQTNKGLFRHDTTWQNRCFFAVVYHTICEHAFRREFSSLVLLTANIIEWKIRICQTSWKAHISVLIIIQYLYHFKRFVPFEYLEMFHFNQISKSRWYKQEIKSSMKSLHKNNVCHQLHEARVMMLGYRKRESFYVHLHRNTVQVKIHYSSGRDSGKIPCLNYTLIIW